ncbi:MAG: Y-family DNA polymerase [Spirochaetales bacterium]|jgi:DNA polymerase V|nr:Y-family DNA polymerase [Spirochaetales bacterium]
MNNLFALLDCNNFYASCERLFRPQLQGKPVVVLSNNDGCIVARSNEAKALGIPMATPFFKSKAFIKKHNVHVFSSNNYLYGDLSNRVMSTLMELEPRVEIYSIDEAFISLPNQGNLHHYGLGMKARVEQCVGIPVSIGIAATKTLAKLANTFAKKNRPYQGVFTIDEENVDTLLSITAVHDIWGIGIRSTEKLQRQGIENGLQLKNAPDSWIRKHLTVTGLRTVMELRGMPCFPYNETPAKRKAIVSSRSFGSPVQTLQELQQAIATHVSIGSEKLRKQGSAAHSLHVFIYTNPFQKDSAPYSGNSMLALPQASCNTSTMIKYAMQGLQRIYKQGYSYNKAGIMLTELVPKQQIQPNLFVTEKKEDATLMAALDTVNTRWGRNTLQFATAGLNKKWAMTQSHKSPAYTTKWQDLPVITI